MADIAGLESSASDAGGVAEQSKKLLDAISASSDFPVPVYPPAAVAPGEADVGLPYADRGLTRQEIEGELKWIRLENPDLDLQAAYRKLHSKRPELFGAAGE